MDADLNVFYIERDPLDWVSHEAREEYRVTQDAVSTMLSQRFKSLTCGTSILSQDDQEIIDECDILITHLQNDPSSSSYFTYGKSIEKLKALKAKKPSMHIIVYTGAIVDVTYRILADNWASAVVRKRPIHELQENIKELNMCLDAVIERIQSERHKSK